jgi:N-acyl homoserine lactone hydrolase
MRLYALEYGQIDMDKRVIMPADRSGTRIVVPVPGYLIQSGDATILVDTGMPRDILRDSGPLAPRMRALGGDDAHAVETIARLGFRPSDLTHIVATHFHFDHAGGLPEFPGIPVVVQRAALAAARGGSAYEQQFVRAPGLVWREIDGDHDLAPGVRLILAPGHAAGHQAVLVELPGGPSCLLAIDTIYTSDQLATDDWGAYQDPDAARASAARVRALAAARDATLVYGHDAAQWATLRHAPEFYGP